MHYLRQRDSTAFPSADWGTLDLRRLHSILTAMIFKRPKKYAVLLYLDEMRQATYDQERWGDRPDTFGDELGNDERCLFCGAPPGKQCMKADGSFRNYPHQKRRDLARAKGKS